MKTNPKKHQLEALEKLNLQEFAWLWDMGLGKTWMGCRKIEDLFSIFTKPKILIVCPNAVTDVWQEEIIKHTNIDEYKVNVCRGTVKQRLQFFDREIQIINFEGLTTIQKELKQVIWNLIIVDESQRIKNHKALQTNIMMTLKSEQRMILSGTPFPNSYLDAFSQFLFLDRGRTFGQNFFGFRNTYFYDAFLEETLKMKQEAYDLFAKGDSKTASGIMRRIKFREEKKFPIWKIIPSKKEDLMAKIATKSHRLEKKDVLDLPEKIYLKRYAYLSPDQKKCYKQIVDDCITFLNDTTCTAPVAITKILRLSQITSGFLKTEEGEITNFKDKPKLDAIKEDVENILLENDTNKIIIWANFRHDVETLQETLKEYAPVIMYGGTTDKKEIIEKFQTDQTCRIFIGNPRSAGLGITLTKANYALYYSCSNNPEDWMQSQDRNYRIGSEMHKNITYINYLVKGTIDEIILQGLLGKEDMQDVLLKYVKNYKGD